MSIDAERSFDDGFTRVGTKPNVELRRCDRCGAHWQVDAGRDSLAIRIEEPDGWDDFDDRPIRMRVVVKKLGGLSLNHCMWEGCQRRALTVSGVCPHHAFPSLSDEVEAPG